MNQENSFTPPCSVDEFQASLLQIYLHGLRQAVLMVAADQWASAIHPKLDEFHLWDPSDNGSAVGLGFDDIRESSFVRAMEQQYQLAAHGVRAPGVEAMEYESVHMWVAAWLVELSSSAFVQEWDSYGCSLTDHINRCLTISELANARLVLNGQDSFSAFAPQNSRDVHRVEHGDLSIHQMALLSGMEEMSVRTAASRKGPSQLITHKNSDGRTVVSTENAKSWLISRGKYVELVTRWDWALMDLAKVKFESPSDLSSALAAHCRALSDQAPERDFLADAKALYAGHGFEPSLDLEPLLNGSTALAGELADLLGLPKELLALRAQECWLRHELGRTNHQIRQLASARG